MTLNVVACNYWHVVQVSDRRLTLNGIPWDDAANKCVVVGCRDALLSITYTGLAYIGEVPTDEWIHGIVDASPGAKRSMGFVVDLLERAATEAFASQIPLIDRGSPLTMLIAGWHWNKKHTQA